MTDRRGPVRFDVDEAPDVEAAAEIGATTDSETAAMARLARTSEKPLSGFAKFFLSVFSAFIVFLVTLWFWRLIESLLASNPLLAQIAIVFAGLLGLCVILYAVREIGAVLKLKKVEALRKNFASARLSGDLKSAQHLAHETSRFYADDRSLAPNRDRLTHEIRDQIDAEPLIDSVEHLLLAPLDARAQTEIEAAARRIAVITALVPVALADMFGALSVNISMIRRIAEIYGGRPGFFGGIRLFRSVLTHLVATGAVAMGDDLLGTAFGAGMLAKLSRRFGEGTINAALTARVGIATVEVCRPAPFQAIPAPSLATIMRRAMTGLIARS